MNKPNYEKYVSDFHKAHLENYRYNQKEDITKYFGRIIIITDGGVNNPKWGFFELVGYCEELDGYLTFKDDNGSVGILNIKNWMYKVVLFQNKEKLERFYDY